MAKSFAMKPLLSIFSGDNDDDLKPPLDSKAFAKLFKKMDKVVKNLQNSKMNVSRSPPCMIDTLPDIYLKLKEINSYYELDRKAQLDKNEFFFITVYNIHDKCKRVCKLFHDNKEDLCVENSESRKQLVNLTIVMSYIYADLKALFPEAQFDPSFRIAKEEAEQWWRDKFHDKIIVPWETFREQDLFSSLNKLELSNLKSNIDLTCNDNVSIFEFDVFTRLFAPWSLLMKTFKKLTFHPGYMASATFENVIAILTRHKDKPGSYVFRMSCTKLGFWSIGYVTDQRKDSISQIVVRDGKPIVEALVEGSQKGFYLYPNGDVKNPDLTPLLQVRPKPQFQVTESQFEEYSLIGSTFQECKICNQRDKDVRLDLCGHLLCSKCLNQWLAKGAGCPFCRCEIRSTQSVVMQPFPAKSPSSPMAHDPLPIEATRKISSIGEEPSRPPPSYPPPALPPGFSENTAVNQINNRSTSSSSSTRRKDSVPAPPNVPLPPPPVADVGNRRPSVVSNNATNNYDDQNIRSGDRRPSVGVVAPFIPSPSSSGHPVSPSHVDGSYINLGAVGKAPPDSLPIQCDGARASSTSAIIETSTLEEVKEEKPQSRYPKNTPPPTAPKPKIARKPRDLHRVLTTEADSRRQRQISQNASTPGSTSSTQSSVTDVFLPSTLLCAEKADHEVAQLPPPPPIPLSAEASAFAGVVVAPTSPHPGPGAFAAPINSGASANAVMHHPVPAPRRNHNQPSPTSNAIGASTYISKELSSLGSPPTPPPPISLTTVENNFPMDDDVYHVPQEDVYNIPSDDVYNVPVGQLNDNFSDEDSGSFINHTNAKTAFK